MEDTVPMPLGGVEPRAADPVLKTEPLRIEFTASGSEYFRIWIVNLVLTLLTLGLYYPWAKVRKLRYFYGNTSVAGHGLDFHGNPRRMLRGYLLMSLLFLLYSVSGKVSALAAVLAAGAIAALWPALFRASQQFRMANTSWRGLRFGFTGDLRGAYVAMLPVAVPLLVFVLAVPGRFDEQGRAVGGSGGLMAFAALAAVALSPACWWLLKRYQHGHYALGRRRTTMAAGVGAFYGVSLKTLGVALLAGIAAGAALAGAIAVWAPSVTPGRPNVRMVAASAFGSLALYAVLFCVVKTFAASRMQNLVWSSTAAAPLLRFQSDLRFASLAALTAKNLVLTVLTLGLYWPFAAVATARLRLEAVSVVMPRGADHFAATAGGGTQDAAGEAAGDLLGFDVGL